jgi:hypothetical protein
VTFKTTKSGLLASQMLPVSLGTPHSLSGNYLIEKVELRYEPNGEVGVWWYHVTATQGPISETWVQWFTRIVQPPHSIVDVSSLGQQSYVALLNTTNETWTWTENVTETVTACPVFPMTFPKVLC